MKAKEVTQKAAVLFLSVAMTLGGAVSAKAETGTDNRLDAESIREANQETEEAVKPEENAEVEGSKKTEYPLTITTYDNDGSEITTVYEKAPEKVLAVYQGSVETMLALGLEDRLVAIAGLDNEVPDEQKAAFSKVEYLDDFTPSIETVTMLEPDMIFSWGSIFNEKKLNSAQSWIEKGVNTYINTNTRPKQGDQSFARTLENEYNDILNIGKIFDVQDKAEAIVAEMKEVETQATEAAKEQNEASTVLMLELMGDTFTNYNASSLGGDMVTKLGGILANPDGSDMGKEDIIAANPDIIFVVYMPYAGDDPAQVKEDNLNNILGDEVFASLNAVQNGRVVPIMLSEMYASATRTMDGMVTIASALYPDLAVTE